MSRAAEPGCLGNQAKLGNTTVSKCKAKDLKHLSAFPGTAMKFCLRQSILYGEFKPKQSKPKRKELNLIPGLVLRSQGQSLSHLGLHHVLEKQDKGW